MRGVPDGIPEDIEMGLFDHREPHPGDNGLRFELREGFEDMLALYEASAESVARDRA